MPPSPNHHLIEAVFLSDVGILELEQPPYHSVNNVLVIRLRQSKNKSVCMLLYSCTTLIHSCTRTSTIPRAALSTDHAVCP